jgi:WD40 repeat protein
MKSLATLTGHTGRIRSVAMADDGCTAVSGGDDQKVRLWKLPQVGLADGS